MNQSIRLMTANLLGRRVDRGHLAGVLGQLDPDLLVTQELGAEAAEVIAARFPHHDLRPSLDANGRGIASRLDADFGEIPIPWRPGLWARVDTGSQLFHLANVHMRNPIVFPWHRSVRIRGRQLDALFEWADDDDSDLPLVVAGDMNATPAWPVYKRLAGRWDDLVARSAEESGTGVAPTWAWRAGWPRVLRVDHVFGRGARVVDTQVEPLRGSDHAALVVELVLD